MNKLKIILKFFEFWGNFNGFVFGVYKEFVVIVGWSDIKIYKIESDRVVVFFNFDNWFLRGFCYIVNGDFLVSLCLMDRKWSKVVRYLGIIII